MTEVVSGVEVPLGPCSMHDQEVSRRTSESFVDKSAGVDPANFTECLGTELQLFGDAELERMRVGLSWLLNQITLTVKMKAKVRALPVVPLTNDTPSATVTSDRTASNGSLTPGDQAAVEAMFRLEGLVNLLHKQLPAEGLANGLENLGTLGTGSKKNEGALQKRTGSKAKRKGNKIGEGAVQVSGEQAQLEGTTEARVTAVSDEHLESSVQTTAVEATLITNAEGGRQHNGGEAHLPLNGMNGLVELIGAESGTGEASGDQQDAPDGDVSKDRSRSWDNDGNSGDGNGQEGGETTRDGQEPPEEARSTADELAEIRSSLASISRQQKFAQGILLYLIVSSTIPAVTLIRWKIRSLRFMNPIRRFQKDMEKNLLGKTDDSVIDELLPWKAAEPAETDPLTQQFHMVQEALGGQSEEEAQISVEADLRAARCQARKHWWQIGPLRPQEDPDLLRTRTERAHLKRLAPLRFFLEFVGRIQHPFQHETA